MTTRPAPRHSRRELLGWMGAATGAAALGPVLGRLPAAAASSATRPFVHGVATTNLAAMHAFEQATGRFVRAFTYYRSLGGQVNVAWEGGFAGQLLARGTTPVLTLQPQVPGRGVDQPAYRHERIVAGDFDAQLTAWARELRVLPGHVVVRPMHEGNGDWYPWCALANGNSPKSYVDAWRHIRSVFDRNGAGNVIWEWSMNKVYPHGVPLAELWPGDDIVDRVGFSGYNGGTVVDRGGWRGFAAIFDESFAEARTLTDKPLFVAETSSASGSVGDRATWITDMWEWLGTHPEVAGSTWFDFDKGHVDWRLATSPESVTAYRRGAIRVVPPRT
jgi:hypothetical protein